MGAGWRDRLWASRTQPGAAENSPLHIHPGLQLERQRSDRGLGGGHHVSDGPTATFPPS